MTQQDLTVIIAELIGFGTELKTISSNGDFYVIKNEEGILIKREWLDTKATKLGKVANKLLKLISTAPVISPNLEEELCLIKANQLKSQPNEHQNLDT